MGKYIGHSPSHDYILEIPHTKNAHIGAQNRTYGINIDKYMEIIDDSKNEEIEEFINNITINIMSNN
jgi:hypothetical protein